MKNLKTILSLLLFTLFLSRISYAEDSPIFMIDVNLNNDHTYNLACSPSQVISFDTKFIIAEDDVESDNDLTSEFLSQREINNYICRRGNIQAGLMKINGKFNLILKSSESFYGGSADSLTDNFYIEKIDVSPEISCGDDLGPENKQDQSIEENNNEEQEIEIFSKEFEQREVEPTEFRYDIYFDGIIDQYFLRDHTDENLGNNERFFQAINMIEQQLLITNVIMGSEVNTTFKLQRLYAYFGRNAFQDGLSIHTRLGQDLWDSMEDFFEGRPQSTRAFANLFSSLRRGGAGGTAASTWHPICSPGLMWSQILGNNDVDIDRLMDNGDFEFDGNTASRWIENSLNFIHEFNHLNGTKHSIVYTPDRDCCSRADRYGVPKPNELNDDFRLPDHDLQNLRSCMERNFGSKRNDWAFVDETFLYSKAYTRPLMATRDLNVGNTACASQDLEPIMSDRNRSRHSWKMDLLSRSRIDGGNTMCAFETRNILPEINRVEYQSVEIDHDNAEFTFRIDANDPDRGGFQIRGADGLVEDRNGIMAYEIRKIWPETDDNFVTSLSSEISINLNNGFNIIEVRVYDYSGSYTSERMILSTGTPVAILSDTHFQDIQIDQEIDISLVLNRRLFPRNEDEEYLYPPLEDPVHIEIDFYGDGSEVDERFYQNGLEEFYNEYPTFIHTVSRGGLINTIVTLRIGDYEQVVSREYQVEENSEPTIDRIIYAPISDLHGDLPSPNFPVKLSVSFYERDENQDHRIIIDWGDGDESEYNRPTDMRDYRTFRTTHSYAEPGDYQVRVRVEDPRGASDESEIELPVKIPVRILGFNGPEEIQPNQRNRFFARATSPYPDARIQFTFDFGHGENQIVRTTVEEAQRGVEVFHQYPQLMPNEQVVASVSVFALNHRGNTDINEREYTVLNIDPEITSARYHLSLNREEINALNPVVVGQNIFQRRQGGSFVQPNHDNERIDRVVTFFVDYRDANGPQDNLSVSWKFSDNGRTFNKRYPNTGEVQISHEFNNIDPNEWGQVTICDSQRACVTRKIFLNDQNRRELLEDQENIAPDNVGIEGMDFNNPFGF